MPGIVAIACVTVEVGGGGLGSAGSDGGGSDGGDGDNGGRDGGIGMLRDRHAHAVHVGQLTPQQLLPCVQNAHGIWTGSPLRDELNPFQPHFREPDIIPAELDL